MKLSRMLIAPFFILTVSLASSSTAEEPQANAGSLPQAATIFASPVHGGCYIAAPGQCKIHVEPFTIIVASTKKLVTFSLIAVQFPGGIQRLIYNWKPDQSNPPPASGTTYTPSLVTQDFAATCGNNYEVSLQGHDSGDVGELNLGLTGQFTCPSTAP